MFGIFKAAALLVTGAELYSKSLGYLNGEGPMTVHAPVTVSRESDSKQGKALAELIYFYPRIMPHVCGKTFKFTRSERKKMEGALHPVIHLIERAATVTREGNQVAILRYNEDAAEALRPLKEYLEDFMERASGRVED